MFRGFVLFILLLATTYAEEHVRPGQSVVKIECTAQVPNYAQPWAPGVITNSLGSGFVISGNRILTNAHVVSHSRFLTVSKQGDPKPYPATVEHIAHDCDLALLKVHNERFFENMEPLEIGGVPALESTVSVYGYPIGGDRISITRGIVSRIDFQPYSHSGADAHLVIQIDAAINPGNSGGPVLQEGKVVGVAFQGFSSNVAQNVGYMIPTPVINRFLHDIRDGSYDHYMDLAISYFNLNNPAARQALGLDDDGKGVLVTTVIGNGSADGYLQVGDVLLTIDGHPIASDGTVELENENILLSEIVERKYLGDNVELTILRNGEPLQLTIPLKPFPYPINSRSFREHPPFVAFAGLIFQPVDADLMQALNPTAFRIRYYFNTFLTDAIYRERPELITLASILPDPVNSYASEFQHKLLISINDTPIRNLADVADALAKPADFYVFRFLDEGTPLVLEKTAVDEATPRIAERYRLTKSQQLETRHP